MDLRFAFAVPAPQCQVDYALGCAEEYPIWNSAVRAGQEGLVWRVASGRSRARDYGALISPTAGGTTISLSRGPFAVVKFHIETMETGAFDTTVSIQAWCSPSLVFVLKQTLLHKLSRDLSHDLAQRARWLQNAPDTEFVAATHLALVVPATTARTASLEQLHRVSRELEGGILAVESATSCCLLDLERGRFARAASSADLQQLVDFGQWQRFEDVICDGDDVVVVPSGQAARIRIRARRPAVI